MATEEGCWERLPSVILLEIFSYLPHKDKIQASSTCKHWRYSLYHASFWQSLRFRADSCDQNSVSRTRYLASCFAKKLRNATVSFNSLDPQCVQEVAKVLHKLSENPNLRRLILMPSHCRLECPGRGSCQKQYFERHLLKPLLQAAEVSYGLESFSLGCVEDLTTHSQRFLEMLARNQGHSLRCLGLASVKDNPDDYLLPELDFSLFRSFKQLQVLSIDYDNVHDGLLLALTSGQMRRLIIHVHGITAAHPGTSDEAWLSFTHNNPLCELRLNFIHSYEAVSALHTSILRRAMPLSHLRAFFCEKLNIYALHRLSTWYSSTLKSVHWVDSLQSEKTSCLTELVEVQNINPLVMCAWRCQKLEEIVLIGYQLYEGELFAIARLRGETLRRFEMWSGDVLLDISENIDKLQEELSSELRNPWKLVSDSQLNPVIHDPNNGDSDEVIIPVVLGDLTSAL